MTDEHGFSLPIQRVEADGISAWLVEDQTVPVVSVAWESRSFSLWRASGAFSLSSGGFSS
jgi:hypothetical protein